jgi:Uma2 family endonuclease
MSGLTHDTTAVGGIAADAPPQVLWRCSVERYHQMVRAGILDENDRVELLDGWLVQKMPENPAHTSATEGTYESLSRIVPPGWYVRFPHPITLSESEPEPDLAVARGDRHRYAERHPEPQDLALVVEEADTTLRGDRTLKKEIYAKAGIPFYWIVNLVDRRLEVFSDPTGPSDTPDYRHRRDYAADDEPPLLIDGSEVGRVRVRDLLS